MGEKQYTPCIERVGQLRADSKKEKALNALIKALTHDTSRRGEPVVSPFSWDIVIELPLIN